MQPGNQGRRLRLPGAQAARFGAGKCAGNPPAPQTVVMPIRGGSETNGPVETSLAKLIS
jgi:hypothetical protein